MKLKKYIMIMIKGCGFSYLFTNFRNITADFNRFAVDTKIPYTVEDSVHDTQTSGPTTQDNLGEPNISFSVQTPGVLD